MFFWASLALTRMLIPARICTVYPRPPFAAAACRGADNSDAPAVATSFDPHRSLIVIAYALTKRRGDWRAGVRPGQPSSLLSFWGYPTPLQ